MLPAGTVYDFNVFQGNGFPFNTGGMFRSGDYSAITLADDGKVYGSTQQSQNISGSSNDFRWGRDSTLISPARKALVRT